MKRPASLWFAGLLLLSNSGVVLADEHGAKRGRAFAQIHCAECHSINIIGKSPLASAPPFRTLHERYPVEFLSEALAEGITTGHPTMPEFRLDPADISDLIDHLKSLE